MSWLKDCEICNAGLCKTVIELKGNGLTENGACRKMSEESNGLYSGKQILDRYRYHTGKDKRVSEIPKDEIKALFNITNENVDWAKYTWNPVTGCKNNCKYCYARDMANRFYKQGFEPHFRPERLKAPKNTQIQKDKNNGVFVCSMADLFGDWVPEDWITKVLKACMKSPQWNYIFLTKNPKRYQEFNPWPDNFWVGATIDVQKRIKSTEEAFKNVEAKVKFISCEPLSEELTFSNLDIFNWVIIGARSKTSGMPAMQPDKEWVKSLAKQAWNAGSEIYCKPNLIRGIKEHPMMLYMYNI